MLKNVIVHIPHPSLKCPSIFYKNLICSKKEFQNNNIFISDYLIDRFAPKLWNIIKFDYSRLFCDVERFKDDSKEPMSKYGMGVIYEKNSLGEKFIELNDNYKNMIIKKYYDPHHKILDNKVTYLLNKYNKCYIIDLHSFSDEFVKQILKKVNNPDICIGYDESFSNKELIKNTINHFKKYGYTVKTNYPYSGSIIPNKYINKKNVSIYSIMIR